MASVSNLDSFVQRTQALPEPKATSQEIRDRGSTFVANIFSASTPEEAKAHVQYLRNVTHASRRATHEISAYRCMVLKPGKTGLTGPDDFELKTGHDDDGEQWAGSRVLKAMESQAVLDAVVIVSRWLVSSFSCWHAHLPYGGIMLGSARFTHIETCTTEVCREFKNKQELEECIAMLLTLDDILKQLRDELALLSDPPALNEDDTASPSQPPKLKSPDYKSWTEADLPTARRIVNSQRESNSKC
ncbi:ribosomal protein S5 domain 2-like protein [Gymnopus androsaceus JB14]|uniref:Ribosomal protein S5 domain 2-like protein n=1 Tax=Gymnopus androsaceus JB14 TaxID=1447944 RepID=A0A6A4IUT6_9AGAR|nr:ribosomal protein S5 domain 2-like protein [Gymnopus androsaceus JB14]